jgi:O-antigen/teichoic acid export membrane protein
MSLAVKKNAVAYYLLFGATAVAGFIVSPILLASLGATAFGLFKAAQKLMDVASVADGRAGQALKWTIARNIASADYGFLRRSISSAVSTALSFSPLLIAIVIMLVICAPSLAEVSAAPEEASLRMLIGVLGANLVLMPFLSIPEAVLMGSNRGYVASLIQVIVLLVTNTGLVLVATSGGGIVALGFIVLGGAVLGAASIFAVTRLSTPWFTWEAFDSAERRRFVGLSGWLLVWAGVEKMLLSGEILLLMGLVSAGAATSYVFASFPVQLFLSVSLLTVSAASPTIASLMSANKAEADRLVVILREGVFATSIVAGCLLLLLNRSFVTLWVGEATYVGDRANLLIVVAMMQIAWIRCDAQLGDLTLEVARRAKIGLLSTGLSLLLSIALSLAVEARVEWVLVGVITGRVLLSVTIGLQVRNEFNVSRTPRMQWVFATVMLACSYWAGARYTADSWVLFIAVAIFSLILVAPMVATTMMSPAARDSIFGWVRNRAVAKS